MDNESWLRYRELGVGSSDVPIVLGISPWKTAYKLWLEKTKQEKAEDISGQWQVQRGVENEPKARAQLELLEGKSFPAQLFIHKEHSYMRVSLDGVNKETLIEIKCPGKKTFEEALSGIIPEYYMAQIQYQLYVSGCEKAIYFCFQPESGRYARVDVAPDKEFQEKIAKAVTKFWDCVQKMEPPELSEKDYVVIENDEDFSSASIRWRDARAKIKELETVLEEAEAELKSYLKKHSAVQGYGVRLIKYSKKGNVQYKNVPELKGVDLEKYRGKPSTVMKISLDTK